MSAKKTTSKQTSAKKLSISSLLWQLKLLAGLICIVAVSGLIWVNTGSRTETGYMNCGGNTFIPKNELITSVNPGGINPGGPCLGAPVTKTIMSRYDDSAPLDWLFGTIAVLSLGACILLSQTKSK